MVENVETTTPDTPLATAARVMIERKIGCLPVVENETLVGILTEGDFVRLVASDPAWTELVVFPCFSFRQEKRHQIGGVTTSKLRPWQPAAAHFVGHLAGVIPHSGDDRERLSLVRLHRLDRRLGRRQRCTPGDTRR